MRNLIAEIHGLDVIGDNGRYIIVARDEDTRDVVFRYQFTDADIDFAGVTPSFEFSHDDKSNAVSMGKFRKLEKDHKALVKRVTELEATQEKYKYKLDTLELKAI